DLNIHIRQMAQVLGFRLVEAVPDRRHQVAQVVLDAVAGGGHVGGADHVLAAQADEIVFVVVGESQHLVGHHVSDVDDDVPLFLQQGAVEADRDLPVGGAAGDRFYVIRGDGADGFAT